MDGESAFNPDGRFAYSRESGESQGRFKGVCIHVVVGVEWEVGITFIAIIRLRCSRAHLALAKSRA